MGSEFNPESLYYVAMVYVEAQTWTELKCRYGCTAENFEPLSAGEVKQLEKRSLEPPRVISAERIPATRRALATEDAENGSSVIDDKFE